MAMFALYEEELPLGNSICCAGVSSSASVSVETPNVNFVRPCNLCPHIKEISLENILSSLWYETYEVIIDDDIARRALNSVNRMINL